MYKMENKSTEIQVLNGTDEMQGATYAQLIILALKEPVGGIPTDKMKLWKSALERLENTKKVLQLTKAEYDLISFPIRKHRWPGYSSDLVDFIEDFNNMEDKENA